MKNQRFKRVLAVVLGLVMCLGLTACGDKKEEPKADTGKTQEINLFVAASLTNAIEELKGEFEKENPNAKILVNADSSGKLKTQIMEGFDCEIFFSASDKEIKELAKKDLIKKGDSLKLLENQLGIIANKDYDGQVTDLNNINQAESIALAYGSVPAGKYARQAMIANGLLDVAKGTDPSKIEGSQVSDALNGVTISEKENVSAVISAVAEKSTELGFAYTSDVNRNKDVKIINKISKDLSGEIVYPIAKISAKEISKEKSEIVNKLYDFLTSDAAKKVYENYGFTAK
ncbi:MAG: molybdate ABC transporter substrate-binding protein [Anaerovoracaceae bacterium]